MVARGTVDHRRPTRPHGQGRRRRARAGHHLLVPVLGRRRRRSPVGRTRTAPAPGAAVDHLRLGLVSCASYAARLVPRLPQPGPARRRPRRPRGRLPLRERPPLRTAAPAATRRAGPSPSPATGPATPSTRPIPTSRPSTPATPWSAVWDDHELAGGAWSGGAHEHVPRRHGPWAERKAAAVQAYWEWMPVRRPDPADPDRIYRMLRWGDLADLALLDTRLVGRDKPVGRGKGVVVTAVRRPRPVDARRRPAAVAGGGDGGVDRPVAAARQPGDAGPHPPGGGPACSTPASGTATPRSGTGCTGCWPPAGGNAAVLSGDIHSSWANDLPVGAEFVGPVGVVPHLRRHPGARGPAGGGGVGADVPVAEPPRADGRAAPPRLRGGRRHPRADPGRLVAPRQRRGPVAGRVVRRRLAAALGPARAGARPRPGRPDR